MIIILTIICLVLLFYLNKNDEDRKAEKTINQRETEKINLLRENNILNKNYSKAEKICNKIINRFPGSSQNIDKRFKLYITQSTIFYIVARGFVLDNTKLSMRWDWSETENLITLKIEVTYNTTVEPKYQKGVSHSTQKTFTFTENESEEGSIP